MSQSISPGGEKNDPELPVFSLKSILAATNNFSEVNKLGEGGFGPVYKVEFLYYALHANTLFSFFTLALSLVKSKLEF